MGSDAKNISAQVFANGIELKISEPMMPEGFKAVIATGAPVRDGVAGSIFGIKETNSDLSDYVDDKALPGDTLNERRLWNHISKSARSTLGVGYSVGAPRIVVLVNNDASLNLPMLLKVLKIGIITKYDTDQAYPLPAIISDEELNRNVREVDFIGWINKVNNETYLVKNVQPYRQVAYDVIESAYSNYMNGWIKISASQSAVHREMTDALRHFNLGEYRDCISDCGNAFESALKVACHEKSISYDQKDTASKLIQRLETGGFFAIAHGGHAQFLTGLRLILESGIPTPRNRVASHGHGVSVINIDHNFCKFVLDQTKSTIEFIISLC